MVLPCAHVSASLTLVSTVTLVHQGFVGALTTGSNELAKGESLGTLRISRSRRLDSECTQGPFHRELRQYFDEVGFYMDEQDWRDYGLGYTANVNDVSGLRIDIWR